MECVGPSPVTVHHVPPKEGGDAAEDVACNTLYLHVGSYAWFNSTPGNIRFESILRNAVLREDAFPRIEAARRDEEPTHVEDPPEVVSPEEITPAKISRYAIPSKYIPLLGNIGVRLLFAPPWFRNGLEVGNRYTSWA